MERLKKGDVRESAVDVQIGPEGAYLLLTCAAGESRSEEAKWVCLVLEEDPAFSGEPAGCVVTRHEGWLVNWTKPIGSGAEGDRAARATRPKR